MGWYYEDFEQQAGVCERIVCGPVVLCMAFGLGTCAGLSDETVLWLLAQT